jgi:hypothetical protein
MESRDGRAALGGASRRPLQSDIVPKYDAVSVDALTDRLSDLMRTLSMQLVARADAMHRATALIQGNVRSLEAVGSSSEIRRTSNAIQAQSLFLKRLVHELDLGTERMIGLLIALEAAQGEVGLVTGKHG